MPISPGVYTKIVDLSDYVRSVPGTFGFIALVSERGPDNRMVLTNARDFYLDFGEPNINYLGVIGQQLCQGKYVASSFLTQSDNLYVIRVTPPSATYSNIAVCVNETDLTTIQEELNSLKGNVILLDSTNLDISDLTGFSLSDPEDVAAIEDAISSYYEENVLILNEDPLKSSYKTIKSKIENRINDALESSDLLNDFIVVGSIKSLNSYSEINSILNGGTLSIDENGYLYIDEENGKYTPLFIIYGAGRGEWYNNFKLKMYSHPNPIKAGEGVYSLDIYEKQTEREYDNDSKSWVDTYNVVQTLDVSLDPTKQDYDGDSLFISDVINRYFRYLESDSNIRRNLLEALSDILIGFNSRMSSVNIFALPKNKKIKLKLNNGNIQVDSGYSNPMYPINFVRRFSINFSGAFDFIARSFIQSKKMDCGDDGLSMYPTDEEKINAINSLLIKAYSGELQKFYKIVGDYNKVFDPNKYVDEVLNTDSFFFNIVLDGGYSPDVKDAIVSLCSNIRQDCVAILDNGNNFNLDETLEKRLTVNNYNNYYSVLYEPYTMIYDKFTGKDIWITPVYHIAKIIPYSENVGEPWTAPVGFNRAVIDNIKEMRYNARQGEREQLYLHQINPIVSFSNGTVVWGQLTTYYRTSALQDLNIVRLLLYVKKGLELYCRNYIFERNDSDTWNKIKRDVEQYMESIKNRRGVYSYNVEVGATDLEIKSKKIHVNVQINPTRVAEQINLSFTIV